MQLLLLSNRNRYGGSTTPHKLFHEFVQVLSRVLLPITQNLTCCPFFLRFINVKVLQLPAVCINQAINQSYDKKSEWLVTEANGGPKNVIGLFIFSARRK